jgi:hypothetical protein
VAGGQSKAGGLSKGAIAAIAAVLGVIAIIAVVLLICRFCCGSGDRVGAKEEEGEAEVVSKPEQAPAAAGDSDSGSGQGSPRPLESQGAHELSGQGESSSSGPAEEAVSDTAPAPEAAEQVPEMLDEPEKGKEGEKKGKGKEGEKRKKKGGEEQGESPEGVQVIECEQVNIASAIGERATMTIPFTGQLWTRGHYRARFEPEVGGLWLSADKGSMEAGAVEFPFALFFEPEEDGSFETTLIVSIGEIEARIPIVASTGGGARRHRHHRQHSKGG